MSDQQQEPEDWNLAASNGPDTSGGGIRRALKEAARRRAIRIAIEELLQHAACVAWRATEFGKILRRKRWILLASVGGWDPSIGEERLARLRLPLVPPCGPWLRPLGEVKKPAEWLDPECLGVDPLVAQAQGPWEPKADGHVCPVGRLP